nr:MAG TPA: hypothetical protein [Caudoviricetes sp.]
MVSWYHWLRASLSPVAPPQGWNSRITNGVANGTG